MASACLSQLAARGSGFLEEFRSEGLLLGKAGQRCRQRTALSSPYFARFVDRSGERGNQAIRWFLLDLNSHSVDM